MTDHEDAYQARRDVVTLRELFEQRWQDHLLVHAAEFHARDVAAEGINKRLESMNEFRAAMSDSQDTFLRKAEYEFRHKALEQRIEDTSVRNGVRIGKLETDLASVTTIRISAIESQVAGMFGRFVGGASVIGIGMFIAGVVMKSVIK